MSNNPALPIVSIIMPTYNRANLIGESIQSICDQTYTKWQLIVVDDGSDDNTEEVVAGFREGRIEFITAGRNGVGGKLKNMGLQQAEGELIAFLDSDDLWANTKLEKQIQALQQYAEAGFCLTGGYNFRTEGKPLDYFYKKRQGAKYGQFFIDYFNSELPAFTQALMFRKECISVTGPFKESKAFSDPDFILNLARHFAGVILYEPLAFRRIHAQNWIDENWIESYYEGIEIVEEYKNELPKEVFRDALFRLHINFGESYLVRKQPAKAITKLITAWKYCPLSLIAVKKLTRAVLLFLYKHR